MTDAIDAPGLQHEELRQLLLKTGERPLVEHTANDSYWGDGGGGGRGKNRLGALLMEVREGRLRALQDCREVGEVCRGVVDVWQGKEVA